MGNNFTAATTSSRKKSGSFSRRLIKRFSFRSSGKSKGKATTTNGGASSLDIWFLGSFWLWDLGFHRVKTSQVSLVLQGDTCRQWKEDTSEELSLGQKLHSQDRCHVLSYCWSLKGVMQSVSSAVWWGEGEKSRPHLGHKIQWEIFKLVLKIVLNYLMVWNASMMLLAALLTEFFFSCKILGLCNSNSLFCDLYEIDTIYFTLQIQFIIVALHCNIETLLYFHANLILFKQKRLSLAVLIIHIHSPCTLV